MNRSNINESNRLIALSAVGMQKNTERVFLAILFAFIVLFLLIALMAGTMVFQALNKADMSSSDNRLGLSLITNSIRANDTTDAVGVGSGPEGKSLVLTERLDNGNFETRIYQHKGMIVQEYSSASSPYTPEKAREIIASDMFSFEYTDGLLTVHTSQGSTAVALHSVREGV